MTVKTAIHVRCAVIVNAVYVLKTKPGAKGIQPGAKKLIKKGGGT